MGKRELVRGYQNGIKFYAEKKTDAKKAYYRDNCENS